MAKRADPRRIHADLSYTVPELARTLGVSVGTVRNWLKQGLRALTTQRPTLILGADAKEFLAVRKAQTKRPLAPDELFCLSCKAPRKPFAGLVQLDHAPGKPARITGFCEACETVCSRVVGAAHIPRLTAIFDLEPNRATRP
jgi:hypothetical protein